MPHSDGAAHVALLSDSLRQLQVQQESTQNDSLTEQPEEGVHGVEDPQPATSSDVVPRRPLSRDGYGFRKSGISTPMSPLADPNNVQPQIGRLDSLVPDPNGLGWPGELIC